ncbi:HNH endonuclease [Pseudothauera nasutitermitis]|uniref:HNH endonuclease n=2 Tax=Pseudothauera nasutitermitis TaxID=2565930 RepID=A0A4S4B375_9RHOO|nr:HNH endonuclease [Pseudothauera nasutitermitis]
MPTKPLDRLMFVQGGLCFFCKQPLPKAEESVEHLLASSNGGSNNDENCVACCKSVNALLGSMSLKEKFQVVLNQKGQFKCPNGAGSAKTATPSKAPPTAVPQAKPKAQPKALAAAKTKDDKLAFVVANLKQRGNSKPRTLKTLTSTVTSLYPKGVSKAELASLLQQLQSTGKVIVKENKVTYAL